MRIAGEIVVRWGEKKCFWENKKPDWEVFQFFIYICWDILQDYMGMGIPLLFVTPSFKHHLVNFADLKIRQWMKEHKKVDDYTADIAQRLINAQERVIKEINKAKEYDKQR